MFKDIIFLFAFLILTAFFAAAEIAFIVGNKIKIEIRARQKNPYALTAKYFIEKPELFFSTILICSSITNIAFASLCSVFLITIFGLKGITVLLITTIIILFFGELIPKILGRELADRLVLISALPIRILSIFLFPFVKIVSAVSSALININEREEKEILSFFDKDDIQDLIEESSEAGKIDEEQSEIISKIIDMREQCVYESMTPRTDILGVEITDTLGEILKKFIESGYSKLPVYDENLDNIKGIVFSKDIFKEPADLPSIMREMVFVPETKKSLEMLNEFLDKQFSIAIVVDEFGGTAGLLTVEDLIEELLGEIRDEYDDVNEKIIKKINDSEFLLSGKVEIDYLNDEFNLNIPEGDYETIAGYITFKLGRIPEKGESFSIDNYSVYVIKSDKTKIDLVKVKLVTSND
jgi:putative hemolysin